MTFIQNMNQGAWRGTLYVVWLAVCFLIVQPAGQVQAQATQQQNFKTPREAVHALRVAAESKDKDALRQIFGPEYMNIAQSGDPVADRQGMENFAAHVKEYAKFQKLSKNVMVLYVGKLNWPMPIPLVRKEGTWYFDTAAGKEEILNRRIGKNEVNAISVCLAFVEAQHEYAKIKPIQSKTLEYAQHFRSLPGQKDGLYWESSPNEQPSPFGPLIDQAQAEGYFQGKPQHTGHPSNPYHGYFYRILKQQGKNAPGGAKDYMVNGRMTGGFALLAYPAKWGYSGIMTLIVNQDGIVYQKNLGPQTEELAPQITAFDPDSSWTKIK